MKSAEKARKSLKSLATEGILTDQLTKVKQYSSSFLLNVFFLFLDGELPGQGPQQGVQEAAQRTQEKVGQRHQISQKAEKIQRVRFFSATKA